MIIKSKKNKWITLKKRIYITKKRKKLIFQKKKKTSFKINPKTKSKNKKKRVKTGNSQMDLNNKVENENGNKTCRNWKKKKSIILMIVQIIKIKIIMNMKLIF